MHPNLVRHLTHSSSKTTKGLCVGASKSHLHVTVQLMIPRSRTVKIWPLCSCVRHATLSPWSSAQWRVVAARLVVCVAARLHFVSKQAATGHDRLAAPNSAARISARRSRGSLSTPPSAFVRRFVIRFYEKVRAYFILKRILTKTVNPCVREKDLKGGSTLTHVGHALERQCREGFNFRKHTLAQGRINTQLRMVNPANLCDTQAAHDDKEDTRAVGDVDYRLERFAQS